MVYNIAEIKYTSCYIKWLCNLVPKRQTLCTQGNLLPLDLKDGFLTDLLITGLLMLILYFLFNLVSFRSMVLGSRLVSGHPRPRSSIPGMRTRTSTDVSRASNQRWSTPSRRGFCRRAGSSARSCRGFSRRAKTRTRSRQGFSRRAKTHTRTRRVVLSPRRTALDTSNGRVARHSSKRAASNSRGLKQQLHNNISRDAGNRKDVSNNRDACNMAHVKIKRKQSFDVSWTLFHNHTH